VTEIKQLTMKFYVGVYIYAEDNGEGFDIKRIVVDDESPMLGAAPIDKLLDSGSGSISPDTIEGEPAIIEGEPAWWQEFRQDIWSMEWPAWEFGF